MEQYTIDINDMIVTVKNKDTNAINNRLTLVKGLSCQFKSGRLTAIMGPSGSCKTTFLNSLMGHVDFTTLTSGSVLLRGKERDSSWGDEARYMEQDDSTGEKYTVYEYIKYQTYYALSGKLSSKEINIKIDNMLRELEIYHIKNREMVAISGGERKRVMLAAEFVIEPKIIFLDEPTTGLDSNLALTLTHFLKSYAIKHNAIVVMTVHQPGPGVFSLFDDFLFIYKGCALYSGEAARVIDFVGNFGDINQTTLSVPEFLFEIFSERSTLANHDEMRVKREALLTQKTKQSESVCNSALMNYGSGYNASLAINPRHVLLNLEEMTVNELRTLRVFKLVLYIGVLLASPYISFLWSILNTYKDIVNSTALLAFQRIDFYMVPLVFFCPVHYVIVSMENTKNSLKKRNYSLGTCMVSTFIYSLLHVIAALSLLFGKLMIENSGRSLRSAALRLVGYIVAFNVISYSYTILGFVLGMKKTFFFLKVYYTYYFSFSETVDYTLGGVKIWSVLFSYIQGPGIGQTISTICNFIFYKVIFIASPLRFISILFILNDLYAHNYSAKLASDSVRARETHYNTLKSVNMTYALLNKHYRIKELAESLGNLLRSLFTNSILGENLDARQMDDLVAAVVDYILAGAGQQGVDVREVMTIINKIINSEYKVALSDAFKEFRNKFTQGKEVADLKTSVDTIAGVLLERNSLFNIGRMEAALIIIASVTVLLSASTYGLSRNLCGPIRFSL
ncbi:hypothetical protein ENBRE01_1316 [Enteropsectra breve]|nr:hypothetical protein ENBRE01_1316 [Enteropsectra breve]